METILILALAVIIDLTVGDPPNILHPVAWMGKVISLIEKGGIQLKPSFQLIYGVVMTLLVTMLFVMPVFFLFQYLGDAHIIIRIVVTAVFLKMTFSIKGLRHAARKTKILLLAERLDEMRFELRALVSRDTHNLSRLLLVSSAIESVGEGTGDSLVAPLFYFLFLGVPGAIGYRVVNTLDAMIGYHGKYEYLGKFAARADDVLNFIPARISAVLISLAAVLKKTGRQAWQTALHQHKRTESPNAGWPMAAMAGALGVQLEKPGHYVLGEPKNQLKPETIDHAIGIFFLSAGLWLLVCYAAEGVKIAITS
jgi:adenosylcobinamide-phosphate synthase